jgi:hypothetical protein
MERAVRVVESEPLIVTIVQASAVWIVLDPLNFNESCGKAVPLRAKLRYAICVRRHWTTQASGLLY